MTCVQTDDFSPSQIGEVQDEDVGRHDLLGDRRPVVALPAVLGHVGVDAGGDLVVDGADRLHRDAVLAMIAIDMSARPCVCETSGERLSVQLMYRARRSEKSQRDSSHRRSCSAVSLACPYRPASGRFVSRTAATACVCVPPAQAAYSDRCSVRRRRDPNRGAHAHASSHRPPARRLVAGSRPSPSGRPTALRRGRHRDHRRDLARCAGLGRARPLTATVTDTTDIDARFPTGSVQFSVDAMPIGSAVHARHRRGQPASLVHARHRARRAHDLGRLHARRPHCLPRRAQARTSRS